MKADFSRMTFDVQNRYSRVPMQQGRVLLDADWNEQTAIVLHYLRTLAADLIGPHGGPGNGFEIGCIEEDGSELVCDFTIGWGHYYVDGILVENLPPIECPLAESLAPLRYMKQPDYPLEEDEKLEHGKHYLVYLDVWERHLTYLQARHIREVALGGPDTATRVKVVWQVKVAAEDECGHSETVDNPTCEDLLQAWVERKKSPACLRARARIDEPCDDPCTVSPESRYRGAENQLYRVEIHGPGKAGNGKDGATFNWSRDNGSVVFPIRALQGRLATLDTLGPDQHRTLKEGDWVEIIDDRVELRGKPGIMAMVDAVDRVKFEVMLAVPEGTHMPVFDESSTTHPLLRRWDQGSDAIPVQEEKWLDLEDGVQIHFEPGGVYHTGDYWLIPARVATGDILWPTETKSDGEISPKALAPKGIEHHYAPLARISLDDHGVVSCDHDCRCIIEHRCVRAEPVEAVRFREGSEELAADMEAVVDRNAASIVPRLAADPNLRVHITGYARSSEELRTARAEVVRDLYVARGIDPDRIVISAGELDDTLPPEALTGVETRLKHVSGAMTGDNHRPTESEPETGTEEGRVAGASLVRIANVGDVRAGRLASAGYDTPEAVASLPASEVSSLLNVDNSLAEKILESARAIARERE